jgi:hypothetical protein
MATSTYFTECLLASIVLLFLLSSATFMLAFEKGLWLSRIFKNNFGILSSCPDTEPKYCCVCLKPELRKKEIILTPHNFRFGS